MSSGIEIQNARAIGVELSEDALTVHLADGRTLTTPLAWYPRLLHATEDERRNFRLVGRGVGMHWPALDEDLSIEGMLSGRPSAEGPQSLQRWLQARRTGGARAANDYPEAMKRPIARPDRNP